MDLFETLKSSLAETGRFAAEKAKLAKDIIVVRDQIRNKKKEIKTLTYKIGLTYMELHPDDYEEAFADFIRGIKEAKEELAEKQAELDELKAQSKTDVDEEDYDILDDENFIDVDVEDLAEDSQTAVDEAEEETASEADEKAVGIPIEEEAATEE